MPASGVIPMKCHDILRDEGLADDEQITVTRGPEPRDRPAGVGIDVRRRNLDRCQPAADLPTPTARRIKLMPRRDLPGETGTSLEIGRTCGGDRLAVAGLPRPGLG
jgi:hypothetical protein